MAMASANSLRYQERAVPFETRDGLTCDVINVRGTEPPTKGPVLLVHGAGVRANIFRAPVEVTIVDYLIDNGYDVWLENWRASIDIPPNPWTLDEAALYDHPKAVSTIIKETGVDDLKAVIHCQGSTSFMMSAVAGLVPQVKTIVSNAVSLHPVVPFFSRIKARTAVPLVSLLTPYVSPRWGLEAPNLTAKGINLVVRATHHECDNMVCKLVSFTYGSGRPALWSHKNLNKATHEWVKQEFAEVSLRFFKQMAHCISAGHLVAYDGFSELPSDFVSQPPETDARFAFLAGGDNLCFLPESQERTFEYFDSHDKNRHSLHVLSGYGHLDIFMGKNAVTDVFPIILDELDKPN